MILSIHKKYSSQDGFELSIDCSIEKGKITALYGPSGSGKTSLLRIIAGLTPPDEGSIMVENDVWFSSEKRINTKPQHRDIGIVFQDYALFPNMSVEQNITYAADKKDAAYIHELISKIGLADLSKSKISSLSGGQQQRVALARALAKKPRYLLLDEPFSAIDTDLKSSLQELVLQVHRDFNTTTLFVSHDLGDVYKMADEVIILEKGKPLKKGSPNQVFTDKEVSGKFQFIGEILNISHEDVVVILTLLIGQQISRVVVTRLEAEGLKKGDKLLIASKAFNPVIKKIN